MRDGTPAREIEITMIVNGAPHHVVDVVTQKGGMWLSMAVESRSGKVDEQLKAIPYSIEFDPSRDVPVKVPPDAQEFFDGYRDAMISHDVTRLMATFSDRFLRSGVKKGEVERVWSRTVLLTGSFEVTITEFKQEGDRAYVAGFTTLNGIKWPLYWTHIIKENGEWKWYGNQRDVAP
jgi:hypothetical protein